MFYLERTKLRVFLLGRPMDPAEGEADEPYDDKDDADNSGRLHRFDVIMPGVLRSIG
jgi:hypothetical protein